MRVNPDCFINYDVMCGRLLLKKAVFAFYYKVLSGSF